MGQTVIENVLGAELMSEMSNNNLKISIDPLGSNDEMTPTSKLAYSHKKSPVANQTHLNVNTSSESKAPKKESNSTQNDVNIKTSPKKINILKSFTTNIEERSVGPLNINLKSDKGLFIARKMMSKEDAMKLDEDQEINVLREKKELEIKKKEEEEKHKNPVDKQKKEKATNEKKKEKEIDGKKLTFDSEGRQVQIKQVPIEKLPVDFVFITPSVGELRETDSAKNTLSPIKIKGGKVAESRAKMMPTSNINSRISKFGAINPSEVVVINGKQTLSNKEKGDKNQDSRQNYQPCGSNFE